MGAGKRARFEQIGDRSHQVVLARNSLRELDSASVFGISGHEQHQLAEKVSTVLWDRGWGSEMKKRRRFLLDDDEQPRRVLFFGVVWLRLVLRRRLEDLVFCGEGGEYDVGMNLIRWIRHRCRLEETRPMFCRQHRLQRRCIQGNPRCSRQYDSSRMTDSIANCLGYLSCWYT